MPEAGDQPTGRNKHLDVLLSAGLTLRRKSGWEVHYAMQPEAVRHGRAWWEAVGEQWDATLDPSELS